MLPTKFSATGAYRAGALDRARGFRLLAHAEIEAFIEDITFEKAKLSVSNWDNRQVTSETLFCLLVHYHQGFQTDVDQPPEFPHTSRLKVKDTIKSGVDAALNQYRTLRHKNNGVKEENLLRLILPVGVRRDDLDELWITNLNEFGKNRGDVAHRAVGAQQQIDPEAEWQVVKNLLIGLGKLDELLVALP